jgi:hypothetical protein
VAVVLMVVHFFYFGGGENRPTFRDNSTELPGWPFGIGAWSVEGP